MLTEALYKNIPIGVCVLKRGRKDMPILYTNKVFNDMLGLKGENKLAGKRLEDIWPHSEITRFISSLKTANPPEYTILPAQSENDKIIKWFKIDICREKWQENGGNIDSFILWTTDISSSMENEKRLQDEVEKADAMAEMKSNFLATMSHEIRTPMQTIYGLLELIHDEDIPDKVREMAEIAQNSASGLLEILDDVLDLAKVDAGKMELDVFEVPVRLLVRGLLEALAVKVHGKNVKLIDDIHDDVPFVVIGDPKRLRQIIMNLCSNALKFTEKGSVTVRVTTNARHVKTHKDGIVLRFEVIDTGIGMSEDVRQKLFGSFTQADSSTARKFGGTGLGLSISKKLVELMGGKIGVESKEGEGSTFWFEIPTEEVSTDETTIQLPDLEGISVLSVEDHPQGAKEIVNSLRSMGATVESCSTSKEGLALVKRRPFDVAVIDQGLPDGLGLDLIKQVMQIRPNMGLVMYTVRDDVGLSHSLQSLGVTYLTKPASRAGLGEAVRNAASKIDRIDPGGPKKLLIAEDTESVRDILQRQLDKLGVEADFATDGAQTLNMLESGAYGILFTDLHMPEIDGYQVVKTIRDRKNGDGHFPVIVLTADVQMAQRETYMRYGFDECLLKPVSLGQFRRLLIRWGLLDEEAQSGKDEDEDENESPAQPSTEGEKSVTDLPPAIDREAMIAQMGAFDESVVEMLGMFVEMTEPLLETLQEAAENEDLHALQETAHSLKGGARSACCNVLGDLAATLQEKSEAEEFAPALIKQIEAEFERVRQAVQELKKAA